MLEISPAGLLGAVAGTVVAALVYGRLVSFAERAFRPRDAAASAQERESFEQEVSLLRRVVLGADIIVLAGLGYWLGAVIGG
jgi:hypothetical protein